MNLVNWRTVAAQEGWRWLQARGIEVYTCLSFDEHRGVMRA